MSSFRLSTQLWKHATIHRLTSCSNLNILTTTISRPQIDNCTQRRSYSFQSTIESVVKTQSGIFKDISESAPVELLQNFLVHFHAESGLPWWFTIVCTTVLLRTCVTLPLAVYQNYIFAKVQNLRLELAELAKELSKEVAIATKLYNWDERTARYHFKRSLKKQWDKLIVRDNCHPLKGFLLVWFQLPMWISFSVALRNLVYLLPKPDASAEVTFLELTTGGFGFIPNLTVIDSTFIMPLALATINLLIIEIQALSRSDKSSKGQRIALNVFRGFSLFMIPVAASVPSAVVLYWTTSSTYGLLQNLILLSPKVKRLCRIPETVHEIPKPYLHIVTSAKKKFGFQINTKIS